MLYSQQYVYKAIAVFVYLRICLSTRLCKKF